MRSGAPLPHPGVRFPPPTLFAAAFLAGWVLETRVLRLPLARGPVTAEALQLAGAPLLAAGLAVMLWGLLTFLRARTAVLPHHAASRLVTGGPYRFTRNPMYVGMTVGYVGLALLADVAWPLLLLPAAVAALVALVVRREERYLAGAFGDAYAEYRRRVPRWL